MTSIVSGSKTFPYLFFILNPILLYLNLLRTPFNIEILLLNFCFVASGLAKLCNFVNKDDYYYYYY